MPALVLAALMSWAGWVWAPFPSVAWVLAETPAGIFLVGLLWRDHPLAMSAYFAVIAAAERMPRWRPPAGGEELPGRLDVVTAVEQADFQPPAVVSLDEYRERKAA